MKNYLITIFIFLSSCANLDKVMTGAGTTPTVEERSKTVSQFSNLTNDQKINFINGEPWIGMTAEELKAMWNNTPTKSQKKLTSAGNVEIQLYEVRVGNWKTGVTSKYYKVTILNSRVIELQELDENIGTFDKL